MLAKGSHLGGGSGELNKKFMQVDVDETCMCTNFDGHHLSSFGNITTFKNSHISLSDHGLIIVHGHPKF